MRELRNQTAEVIDAVMAGERVTLTVRGTPVADIVPHATRARWLPGDWLAGQLEARSADAALTAELEETVGHTLDEV